MTQMWVMNLDAAEAFFELCIMREAVTEKERLEILQELTDAGRAQWFSANASKDEIVAALASKYNVYKVKRNERT